jgi:hypothetical protein
MTVTDTKIVVTDTKTVVMDTKTVVTDTNTMVAGMYRNMVTEREGASGKNNSVGTIYYPSTTDCSPPPRLEPGQ